MPSAPDQPTSPREDQRIGDRDLAEWRTSAGRLAVAILAEVSAILGRALGWSRANVALVLTLGLGLAVVWLFAEATGEVYESVVDRDGIAVVDQPVLDAAVDLRTPTSAAWATHFTDLGGTVGMPVIAVLAAVGLTLAWRRWTPAVLLAVGGAGSLLMTVTGKGLAGRARPPETLAVPPFETSASFPSGHTLNATVVLGLTAYLLAIRLRRRRWRAAVILGLGLVVVAMGLSRVFLGHHWFTDVAAGWAVGLGWVTCVVTGHRVKITLERSRRPGRRGG